MLPVAVDREEAQARLNQLAAGTLGHRASQPYTVADRFEERAATAPERPFVFFEDRVITYGAFNALANRVAHVARATGLSSGDVAGLMMENRPEFLACWVGLAKLGVTIALINTHLRGQPLIRSIETTGARRLFVGSECMAALGGAATEIAERWPIHVWGEGAPPPDGPSPEGSWPRGAVEIDAALAEASDVNPDASVRAGLIAEHDLFHIFTSGTTGLPKAARLSHMRFLGVGDGMSSIAGWGPDDVIACVLPLYHGAAGMVVVSSALAQGGAIALRRRFSASRFWEDVRRYGVTGFQYIGEICRYLLNQPASPRDRDHTLRVMMGAGLAPGIWEAFQSRFGIERIIEGWSSTEANTNMINLEGKVGSCGYLPFKDRHNGRLIRYDVETDTHPRDASGFCIECGADEPGEFIGMILDIPDSGAGRFEGYTSARETERKILRDVFQKGDSWYRSGDLLRHDADDFYYFVDRIGDTFRWKSENVSTQEVVEALEDFPGLEVANVFGVQVPGAEGRAGMAALVMSDREAFDGKAFFELAAERLPGYAAPVFVRLVGQADMTSTFKLKKVDLQREGYDRAVVRDPLFVRDETAGAYVPLTDDNLPG